VLLPVAQFVYNATLQKKIGMLLFKVNYGYNPVTSFILKQMKKLNKVTKKKVKKLMILHKKLYELAKLVRVAATIHGPPPQNTPKHAVFKAI